MGINRSVYFRKLIELEDTEEKVTLIKVKQLHQVFSNFKKQPILQNIKRRHTIQMTINRPVYIVIDK